ncbi:MAG: hypothetical protein L0323_15400 [Planctomycetes bacterium]|nr:hypothetical protein [Planctomycetota bacterium]
MPKCEMCGNDFTPSSGAVTSLRILCPPCETKRQAAKAAASRPAPAAPARPAPAARPTSPAPAAARAATSTAARPAPRPEARRAPEPTRHPHPIPGKTERDPIIFFGWIAAAVLIIVGGGIVLVIKGKKDRERQAFEAREARLQEILTKVRSLDPAIEAQAVEGKRYAEEKQDVWKDTEIAPEVESLLSRFAISIEMNREKKDLRDRHANIEEKLKNPQSVPVEEMREIRRKLEELDLQKDKVGPEFVASVGQTRNSFERVYVDRLREDAKSFAAANPDKGLGALARYKEAEDEIYKSFERAHIARLEEAKKYFEEQYRGIQAEGDALCASVFTPEMIERIPWKPLLGNDMTKEWIASSVEGFSWRIEREALRVEGPAKGSGKKGILSIGDRDKWRDFVLEFEVTFESGEIELFVRLGQHADRRAMSVSMAVGPEFTAGAPYSCELTCIGNKFSLKIGDQPPFEPEIPWTVSRKGSVGIVVDEETKVRFSKMRIRILR